MRIQYMSDLHLELAENSRYMKEHETPVTGDILVVAGDTFYLNNKVAPLGRYLNWASRNYRQVLLVPGNHEYYNGCDVMERGMQWRWMFRQNVGYYQNQVVRIDDTDFILSTLWSHIKPEDEYFVRRGLNDFCQTKYEGHRLNVENYNQMHNHCLDFIRKSVAESTVQHIVVVTHHLPTLEVVAAQYRGTVLNSAFATELGNFIADSRVDAWIYGHSHSNIDAVVGGTKVISNQLGYVFHSEHLLNGFDAGKFLEIK